MRVGYGYNRSEKDFAKQGCDRLFLDTNLTKRSERADMLYAMCLRPGDVVVVYFERDLGRGRELAAIRKVIEGAGATIEAFGQDVAPKKAPEGQRGMPYEAAVMAQKWWHAPGIGIDWINEKLVAAGYGPFARHQFIYTLGNRGDAPRVLTKPDNE